MGAPTILSNSPKARARGGNSHNDIIHARRDGSTLFVCSVCASVAVPIVASCGPEKAKGSINAAGGTKQGPRAALPPAPRRPSHLGFSVHNDKSLRLGSRYRWLRQRATGSETWHRPRKAARRSSVLKKAVDSSVLIGMRPKPSARTCICSAEFRAPGHPDRRLVGSQVSGHCFALLHWGAFDRKCPQGILTHPGLAFCGVRPWAIYPGRGHCRTVALGGAVLDRCRS